MATASTRFENDRLAAGRREGRAAIAALAGRVVGAGAVLGVVAAGAGLALGGWAAGVVAGLVVWGAAAAGGWFGLVAPRLHSAESRVLDLVGPYRDADPRVDARYLNIVEGLAPAAGLPRPECLVIDDPSVNVLAIGRDPRHGVVLVTTGLLERLSRMELEAVVARALAQLRDGATMGPTVALALGRGGGARESAALAADLLGVSLTRYPPGLSAALRAVLAARAEGSPDVPRSASPALVPLWLAPPGAPDGLERRAEALEEM